MEKNEHLETKWGKNALAMGWTALPTSLFFAQSTLNLTPLAFNVLCQIVIHWWDKRSWPHPSQKLLSIRVGMSVRSINRAIKELEFNDLIIIQKTSRTNPKFKGRNIYNLSPLVEKLNELTPFLSEITSNKTYLKNENVYKDLT
jgi:hypothetical protein